MTASWPVVPAFLAGRSTRHSTPGPPGVRWRVERVERPPPKNLPIEFSPMCHFTTLSRVERVQISPSPRRADAACLENRGLTATTLIYAGHGVPTEYVPYGPDTARVYLMSQQGGHGVATDRRTMRTGHRAGVNQSQFRPSKLRMAPMIKI